MSGRTSGWAPVAVIERETRGGTWPRGNASGTKSARATRTTASRGAASITGADTEAWMTGGAGCAAGVCTAGVGMGKEGFAGPRLLLLDGLVGSGSMESKGTNIEKYI